MLKRLNHRYLIEVDCTWGQFKLAILKDEEFTINSPIFFITLQKKKKIDALNFKHLLADGQLLMLYLPLLDICGLNEIRAEIHQTLWNASEKS